MTEAEELIAEAQVLHKNAVQLASQETVAKSVATGSIEPVLSWWYAVVLEQTVGRSASAAVDLIKTYKRLRSRFRRESKQ